MKPEARISKDIRELLTQTGFIVWNTEQGYRKERGGTRMSPGIPDLLAAGQGYTFLVEVKTPKGRLTVYQELFRQAWTAHGGISLVWRSVEDCWNWMVSEGIIGESPEAA